jgi:exosortase/archaeosortase family protein
MAQRFAISYLLWLGILFGLFYWAPSPLAHTPNEFLRLNLLKIMDAGLAPGQVQGSDIWINPHYKLMIEKACNGMIPVLMYLASIFAYPSSWKRRLVWGIMGSATMLLLNVARIYMVTWFVMQGGRENFSLSHDIFGNAIFMIAGLGMFYGFIRKAPPLSRRLKEKP